MKELSLNILDVAENSVKAGATLTEILLTEQGNVLTLCIKDDGCGMDAQTVQNVTDPFYTTRTTRPVGLGLPLLKLASEQTGGTLTVQSRDKETYPLGHGTVVKATFHTDHIDCVPLGDIPATVMTLVQGHPDTDFLFCHEREGKEPIRLHTKELRDVLGDVPLGSFEVLTWIKDYLREAYGL